MKSTAEKPEQPDATDAMRGVRLGVLVVSAAVGASAIWGVWDAIGHKPHVWALLGFEIVTIVAALLGVLVGLGRFREAPALSVFSVAGTVFASATLGRFSAIVTRAADTESEGQALRHMLTDPMFDARFLAAVALGGLALVLAFGRDGRSWRRLVAGTAAAVPVLAAMVWGLGSGRAWLLAPVERAGGVARVVGTLVGGLVLIALAAAAVHLIVRSFQDRLSPLGVKPALGGRKKAARKTAAGTPNKGA